MRKIFFRCILGELSLSLFILPKSQLFCAGSIDLDRKSFESKSEYIQNKSSEKLESANFIMNYININILIKVWIKGFGDFHGGQTKQAFAGVQRAVLQAGVARGQFPLV